MNDDFLKNEIFDVVSKSDLSQPLLVRVIDYVIERKEIKDVVQKFDV